MIASRYPLEAMVVVHLDGSSISVCFVLGNYLRMLFQDLWN